MKKLTNEATGQQGCKDPEAIQRFHRALDVISGKWTAEILYKLNGGKRRFGELRKDIPGITQHMLTARLRELEAHGLVARTVYAEVPPRVEYAATPAAQDLRPVFEELLRWARIHSPGELMGRNQPSR
jgi:DNA-binding HxlR family transcriptional regulator